VDDWIEKVSAIFTYSRAKDMDLLRILPLVLHGNASEWFTTLGEEGRARLTSWDAWKASLRNGFYLPDHEMTKQMLCRNRTLKRNESFGDYFQSRRALQRYVYPPGTIDKVLIKDIMEGIPQHLHPIIRANSIGVRNIEDFRRVLIDLEPGIRDTRAFTPHLARSANTHKGAINNINSPSPGAKDTRSSPSTRTARSLPKTPCRCGEMHWYADCPHKKKTANVNFAAKKEPTSSPNNIPIAKPGKWRSWDPPKTEATIKEVNAIHTRSKKNAQTLPEASVPLPKTDNETNSDICPTFAIARIGTTDAVLHKVCIDTGSSISCIDYDYARKHLPNQEINSTSNLRLMGVGTNMTTGSMNTTLHLETSDPHKPYRCDITLYVVPRLNTKVIIGNDILVLIKASIDLERNVMTFADNKQRVIIASTRTSSERHQRKTARTKEVFIVQPGHQARVPILIDQLPAENLYYLEASHPLPQLHMARSVGSSASDQHYAMICNFGRTPIKIPAGTLVGHPLGVSATNSSQQKGGQLDHKSRKQHDRSRFRKRRSQVRH
jgi:hypothetical protein